ncbi:MAG: squalene synthase HpnC [Candidatus Binatia bacterium]
MATSVDRELSFRYCLRLARSHPENFFIGSLFLPRTKRRYLAALYAYARLADDIADGDLPTSEKLAALDCWEERLDACLAGSATHPVFVALGETVRECGLPVEPLRDLLRAFRYDAAFEPFATFDDLRGYCRSSANPVGRTVLALFDYRSEELYELSDAICTALQLTNFWQDLGVDLARGRLYLPLEDLERFGVSRRALEGGHSPRGLRDLMRFEVERTRELFRRGLPLADRVGPMIAREVRMFASGGLTILRRLEDGGYSPVERRPRLTTADKLRLLAAGLVNA